ncbi:MAG: hypothetical protein Q7J44_06210 [Pseudotabrizicola sp.]|uniref:hypothetical protein n=1 Tax=Pseudotabrizicola sp. TaxID=2939647 RepID=UPI002723AA9A|nr:hypothetical protein [Pseudotabrizicola sp.]MDO9638115.1 hypothetical protein [Pseudotabrizicola sp.]
MSFDVAFNLFTPADAAKITGVSQTLQRNWRRHGYLPEGEGHTRFDVFSLAELYALGMLAERGVGPHQSVQVVELLGAGMVWGALECFGAYEGPKSLLAYGENTDEENAAIQHAKGGGFYLPDAPLDWLNKSDKYTRAAFRLNGFDKRVGRVIPARFFLWFPDGSHSWEQSVDHCFNSPNFHTDGPVIVLDQRALGRKMVAAAPRPFVKLKAD